MAFRQFSIGRGECERVRAWVGGVGWVGAGATAWIERRPRTRDCYVTK
ncbi:hypothetical protein INCEPTION_75 [Proteus phage vB_PmiS_Inception]|nr:hypothetical protein INCEPTION_75 [Proteus phage vB_PmiS_Inception]